MKFYTYEIWDPIKNEPFYVGKGTLSTSGYRRPEVHIEYAKGLIDRPYDLNGHKLNRIRKILSLGYDPEIRIVFKTDSEQEAFQKERELIKFYGRRDLKTGCLTNMTDGGDGGSGRVWTQESKDKIKNAFIKKGSYPMSGKRHSLEAKEKIRIAHLGMEHHPMSKEGLESIKKAATDSYYVNNSNPFYAINKNTSRPICQINKNGEIVNTWPSMSSAARELGIKHRRLLEIQKDFSLFSGYYWRYPENLVLEENRLKNIEELNAHTLKYSHNTSNHKGHIVDQLSLEGVFIKRWASSRQIEKNSNIQGLSARVVNDIINNKRHSNIYKNFIWKKPNVE